MPHSFIVLRFTEGDRVIGVADTASAETIAHRMNSLHPLGGGTIHTRPVKLLTLDDAEAIAEFIEDNTA